MNENIMFTADAPAPEPAAPPLSYAEALAAMEPMVRFFEAAQRVRDVIERGASLEQAASEVEARIRDKREELAGFDARIGAAQRTLASTEAKARQAEDEARDRRAAVLREIAGLETARDERKADLAAIEQRIADAKAASARILAGG